MMRHLTWLAAGLLGPILLIAGEPENTSPVASAAISPQTEYANSLIKRIEHAWIYPKRNRGKTCRVLVTQAANGEVLAARITSCDSKKLAESVYAAVFRSSPLPLPADPAIFNPRIELTFVVPRD